MNFTLQKPYRYNHLKIWFEEHKGELPKTLNTSIADHRNLPKSIGVCISSIDKHLRESNKVTPVVGSYKRLLVASYEALQDRDNWNRPMEKVPEKRLR
jgi:hypothetical protein